MSNAGMYTVCDACAVLDLGDLGYSKASTDENLGMSETTILDRKERRLLQR